MGHRGNNVQTMVFGNLNEKSGTGVAFTRNPSDGDKELIWGVFNERTGRRCRCGN